MLRCGKLAGERALVTGAGRGLGREIALELAREGADVVLHYNRSAAGAESAIAEIQSMGRRATTVSADLGTTEATGLLVDQAVEFLEGLDILVNNAGITAAKPFVDVTPDDYDLLYNVNMRGQFFCAQAAVKQMLAQGQGGVIINMTSVHGCTGFPEHSAYDGTKGAIWSWTRELAIELAPLGIRVNGIAPGWIAVESHFEQIPGFDPDAIGQRMVPMRRLGIPLEIARACVFLASEDSQYVAGHVLVVDGGATAKSSIRVEDVGGDWSDT